MNPLVSVVMPVFNGEKTINRAIKSFMAQTLKEIELIVVNDGSTDNTKVIIEKFASEDKRICIIDFEKNYGTLIARKKGIMAAKGDYVMFLDADDALFLNACNQAWIQITKTKADIFHFGTKVKIYNDEICDVDKTEVNELFEMSPVIENLYKLLEPFEGVITG